MIHGYRDLRIWQLGMSLVEDVYRVTAEFPRAELFRLSSQMQRAAVSVPANIAEGFTRGYTREYMHHLAIAHGSLAELATHAEIARRLRYLSPTSATQLLTDAELLSRRVRALRTSLADAMRDRAAALPSDYPSLIPHPPSPPPCVRSSSPTAARSRYA